MRCHVIYKYMERRIRSRIFSRSRGGEYRGGKRTNIHLAWPYEVCKYSYCLPVFPGRHCLSSSGYDTEWKACIIHSLYIWTLLEGLLAMFCLHIPSGLDERHMCLGPLACNAMKDGLGEFSYSVWIASWDDVMFCTRLAFIAVVSLSVYLTRQEKTSVECLSISR